MQKLSKISYLIVQQHINPFTECNVILHPVYISLQKIDR